MTTSRVTTKLKAGEELLTWLEIDQAALISNLTNMRALTLPSAEMLAVVKANGYGHGLVEIAKLLDKRVTYLGVASVDEAVRLKEFGVETPILLFGVHFEKQIEVALEREIALSVSSLEQAELIHQIAADLNRPAVIHIKVDTGMGRLGIPLRSAKTVIPQIHALGSMLKMEGIYTHFPVAEQDKNPVTERQVRQFQELIAALDRKGIHFAFRHSANSAGAINFRSAHLNLIRPGLSLYGIYPDALLQRKVRLMPVLHWRARVILVKNLEAGESVGYGQTFVAKEKTKVAILPVGYSHGYPFALSGKSSVLIHGKRYPLAGRVSMDYLAVAIGRDAVNVGDQATLIGSDGAERITAEALAAEAGTIPYEIVTRIHPQIPRKVMTKQP